MFISFLIYPIGVHANGTSFLEDSSSPSGHVLPMEEGIVRINKEKIMIDIANDSSRGFFDMDNPPLVANIQVIYEIVNETKEMMDVPIAFPQPGDSYQWNITLDGENVPLSGKVKMDTSDLTGGNLHKEWVHPRTNENYVFSGYDALSKVSLESKTFNIQLKAKESHELQINYEAGLGIDETRSLHPVYRLDYLLYPASYWSDFKDLSIQVKVLPKSFVHTNLSLKQNDKDTYVAEFTELPKENLVLFISPSSGVVIDLFHSRGTALFFLVLWTIMFLITHWKVLPKMKNKILRQGISLALLFLSLFIGYDILSHKLLGYPFTTFQFIVFIGYVILLCFVWVLSSRKRGGGD
ncbi:hypothetical protein [Oceanobacillus limi]|nr:hypothetical protein [Oceanobacillus limi]